MTPNEDPSVICPRCRRRWRHRASRKRQRWQAIISVSAGLLLGLVALTLTLAASPNTQPDLSTPAGSSAYVWPGQHHDPPVGITLSGLQDFIISPQLIHTMERQIRASRIAWHANTIRLQILQDRLVGIYGTRHDRYYMYVIKTLTNYAIHLGLNVVLNAQTELSVGYARDEPLPTHTTWKFWQYILSVYQDNPHVWLDLFNEPRHCDWQQWQEAHQYLVNKIRATDAINPIWVEGLAWASTLEGVPMLSQPAGYPPIVYTIHHPGSTTERVAPASVNLWWQSFGYLCARGVPCVDAEFANYIGNYHWLHAARLIPQYFRYLTRYHAGMMAWSLVPGALNKTANYTSASTLPQGDGDLVKRFFAHTSHYYSHHGKRKVRRRNGKILGAKP